MRDVLYWITFTQARLEEHLARLADGPNNGVGVAEAQVHLENAAQWAAILTALKEI